MSKPTKRNLRTRFDPRSKAQALKDAGRYGEAEEVARAALAALAPHSSEAFLIQSDLLNELGDVQLLIGHYAAASKTFDRAIASLKKAGKPDLERRARLIHNRGVSHYYRGAHREALPLLERALNIRREKLGARHWTVAESLDALGCLYLGMEDFARAEQLSREAVSIYRAASDKRVDLAIALGNVGEACRQQGQLNKAERMLEEAAKLLHSRKKHPTYLSILNSLSAVYFDRAQFAKALSVARRVLGAHERRLGPGHPSTVQSLRNCAEALWQLGRDDEAEALRARARAAETGTRQVKQSRPRR